VGLALFTTFVVSLRVPVVGTAVANGVLGALRVLPGATLSVGQARGDWLTRLELRGVRLTGGGITFVAMDTVRARYSGWRLLTGRLDIASAELSGVVVDPRTFTVPRPPPKQPGRRLTFEDVLHGRFYAGPRLRVGRLSLRDMRGAGAPEQASLLAGVADSTVRLMDVRLEAHEFSLGGGFAFMLDTLALRLRPTRGENQGVSVTARGSLRGGRLVLDGVELVSPNSDARVRGELAYADQDSLPSVWMVAVAAPLDLADLSAFVGTPDSGAAASEGLLHAEAELRGRSLERVSGHVRAEIKRGRLLGVSVEPLQLAAVLDSGRAEVQLDALAESAPLAVRGWVRPLDARPAYELRATTSRLPARLGGLAWWPELARRAPFAVDVRVKGEGFADVVAEFEGSARGDGGELELQGRVDRRKGFLWEVARLELRDVDVARMAGVQVESRVTGVLRANGESGPRGVQRARAKLELGVCEYGRWHVSSGQVLATLDGRGGGASLSLESAEGALDVDTLTWRMEGSSPFRMRGARLQITDLAAASGSAEFAGALEAAAELEGTGFASLVAPRSGARALRDGRVGAHGRVTVSPSKIRGRSVTGGQFTLALARGQVTLEGGLESDAGSFSAEADSRPFDEVARHRLRRLRFDDVDLGAWLRNPSLHSRLSGALLAETQVAAGSTQTNAAAPRWSAELQVDRGFVGPLAYERGDWRATGQGALTHLDGRLEALGGTIVSLADVRAAGDGSTAHARLEIPFGVLPALLGRDTLRADGALSLTLEASGSLRHPASMLASGRVRAQGSVERATVDSLVMAFHLERGTVTVDTLALRSDVATARASGRVALTDPPEGGSAEVVARLHAELDLRDPSRLAPLLGADSLSLGSGTLVLDISGPARARGFTLRTDLRALVWNDLHMKRAMATASGRVEHASLRDATAHAEAEWVTLGGLRVPSARFDVTGDPRLLHWKGGARFRDRDTLSVAGDLASDSSSWALALDRMDLTGDSARWQLAHPARLTVREQLLDVDGFEAASSLQGRVLAKGVLDRAGTQDFHVELRDVGLGVLLSVAGLANLRGELNGKLDVSGPAATPRAKGDVRATLDTGGKAVGVLGADFDWTREGLELLNSFSTPERDSLVLSGHLPIAFTLVPPEPGQPPKPRFSAERAEMRLRATLFPLASLQPLLVAAGVGVIAGTLDMDLRLTGRGKDFSGDGQAAIVNGRLELPGLGGKFSGLKLRAAWQGDRLVLQEFHTLAGKGQLDASGSLRFATLTRAEPDLTIKAERALLVDTKELKMLVSGEVRLGGALSAPTLKGRLSFGGSQLLIAQETLADPNAKAVIPLAPEDLRTLEETFTYIEPSTPSPLLGIYDASDLDLVIDLARNNWIRQSAEPRLSVEVFGEVRMQKKPGAEPYLVGRLEPLPGRGYLEQFGRSFALTGGEVLLNGPMSSHTLDLRAQYPSERDAMSREENDVVVHLDLQGTLEKMRLVFSSEPPLSETEIITFIATGRSPTTRTGQSQAAGSEAVNLGVDMGMAMVSGALEDAAKGSVGLDVLKVGYDGVQGTTLIAGRYVAPQLYVGFRQPLQTMNNNTTSLDESSDTKVELEYAAYRWLVLNVQGESSFIRSYLRFRREY
jgi:translocation and assembly module TamB